MQWKCRQCSRLFYRLKAIFCRFIGRRSCCQRIFAAVADSKTPVELVYSECPRCACESFPVSRHSPGRVGNCETISRFIFSPMFTTRQGTLLPNFYTTVASTGCSSQRDDVATNNEISELLRYFMAKKDDMAWLGFVTASARSVRELCFDQGDRAVCLYDTGLPHNPAHCEMYESRKWIEETDGLETRNLLFKLFGNGVIGKSEDYRSKQIWNAMPKEWVDRTIAQRAILERRLKAQQKAAKA
jgi:hypothetical protein